MIPKLPVGRYYCYVSCIILNKGYSCVYTGIVGNWVILPGRAQKIQTVKIDIVWAKNTLVTSLSVDSIRVTLRVLSKFIETHS